MTPDGILQGYQVGQCLSKLNMPFDDDKYDPVILIIQYRMLGVDILAFNDIHHIPVKVTLDISGISIEIQ